MPWYGWIILGLGIGTAVIWMTGFLVNHTLPEVYRVEMDDDEAGCEHTPPRVEPMKKKG